MRYQEPADEVFAPDCVLPIQWHGINHSLYERPPELRLMLAILEDAIRCFKGGFTGCHDTAQNRDQRRASAALDAEEWLFLDSGWPPFDVESICDVLGVDLAALRVRLRRPAPIKLERSRPRGAGLALKRGGVL